MSTDIGANGDPVYRRPLETLPGPYCNDEGDWWVPVAALSYLDARRLVKRDMDDSCHNRLVYHGKVEVWLDAEDEGCEDDQCSGRFKTLSWHFEEQEP